MHQSKLTLLLSTFMGEEQRQFKKMLQSPFHTSNRHLLSLYQVLKKFHPNYNHEALTKEYLFEKIFPSDSYDDNKIKMLIRDLTRLIEDYLVWRNVKKQKFNYQKQLLSIYTDRGLFQWYERTRNRLFKELAQQPYRDLEYFNEMYYLDFNYFFHPLTTKDEAFDNILLRLMDSVDKQFVLAKYRILSEIKNREQILDKEYDIRFEKEIKASSDFLNENTFFNVFSMLFELYIPEHSHLTFHKLKVLFNEKIQELRRVDQSLLLTQLLNFTIREINLGKSEFYNEALYLYKKGIEHQLLIEKNYVTATTFGNIVALGCQTGEFEWTKSFMDEFKDYLKEDIKKDVLAMNQGLWFFYQNKFSDAYDLFLNHSFSSVYQPKARFNLIRTIYEQFLQDPTYYEFLMSQIDAFEQLLYRKDLLVKYHKEAYLHSIQILKRMIKSIDKRKNTELVKEQIHDFILKKKHIIAKDWLLIKVDEL